jgi:hypothetical protein
VRGDGGGTALGEVDLEVYGYSKDMNQSYKCGRWERIYMGLFWLHRNKARMGVGMKTLKWCQGFKNFIADEGRMNLGGEGLS